MRTHGFNLDVEFVIAVAPEKRGDRSALDDGSVFREKDLGVVGDNGLPGLVAHRAIEDVVGRGRECMERLGKREGEGQGECR